MPHTRSSYSQSIYFTMDSLEVKPGYTSQDRCILGYKKRPTIDRELRLLAPNHAVKDFRRDECALLERAVSSSALPLGDRDRSLARGVRGAWGLEFICLFKSSQIVLKPSSNMMSPTLDHVQHASSSNREAFSPWIVELPAPDGLAETFRLSTIQVPWRRGRPCLDFMFWLPKRRIR
jgi:hypothetical protein